MSDEQIQQTAEYHQAGIDDFKDGRESLAAVLAIAGDAQAETYQREFEAIPAALEFARNGKLPYSVADDEWESKIQQLTYEQRIELLKLADDAGCSPSECYERILFGQSIHLYGAYPVLQDGKLIMVRPDGKAA
jgi:hypothetical protein